MAFDRINYISAVLIVSENAARLADFYKNILKIPLEDEQHDDEPPHYGCELGDLHFAIHPAKEGDAVGIGCAKLAFEVFDMEEFTKHLTRNDVPLIYPPKRMGPMLLTAIHDPDGNIVEFTQLGKGWINHIEKRRKEGHCLIAEWTKRNPQ